MPEDKRAEKPQLHVSVGEVRAGVGRRFLKLEGRLTALSKRTLIVLAVMTGFLSLLVGVGLGYILNPYRPTPAPDNDLSIPPDSTVPETISQSGILRKFETSQDGIDFYIEKQDNIQVLLTASEQIDISLLSSFEGLAVTVEGKVTKSNDGSKDVLRVEKIWIKK